jgi:hypothetical protein
MARRKKRRKPIRFKPVIFKLTEGQKAALERFCKAHKTTPVRFIKHLIMSEVDRYRPETPPPSYVTENQLDLFPPSEE